MGIVMENSFNVPAPPEQVWTYFQDFKKVAACAPGAELTSQSGNKVEGKVAVKMGPVKLGFKGVEVAAWYGSSLAQLGAEREDFARYYDEIARFDTDFGQVMKTLADRGLASNTIVAQHGKLDAQVAQLTALLGQNEELHERVRRAAARLRPLRGRSRATATAVVEPNKTTTKDLSLAL